MARNRPISSRISMRGIRPSVLLLGSGSDNNTGGPLFPPPPPPPRGSGNNSGKLFGLGFLPDRPDGRDQNMEVLWSVAKKATPPKKVDLSADGHFSPVDEQGPVQCSAAFAVASIAEYHFSRQRGKQMRFSRLFLYKVARELAGLHGDVGCTLRDTIKALNRYGCLEESRWPYTMDALERLPTISELEEARQWSDFAYCRLDDYNANGQETLGNIQDALAAGYPVALGFTVCAAIDSMKKNAVIPFPRNDEESRPLGGHAVVAVGYDSKKAGGALLIRNSWGEKWGREGHAWLPFEYVKAQLACDCWVVYRDAHEQTDGQ